MKVFSPEAFANPALQVEYIKNDPTGWAIAKLGMGVGGIIVAIGMGLFARETKGISDNQNTRMASSLGAAMVILSGLVFAIINYYDISQPPEAFSNAFNTPNWMWPTYNLTIRFGILLTGYVLVQSGYSKKMGWVMIVLAGLLLALMGADAGPPAINSIVFLIMGITLLFKRSPSPQSVPQTA